MRKTYEQILEDMYKTGLEILKSKDNERKLKTEFDKAYDINEKINARKQGELDDYMEKLKPITDAMANENAKQADLELSLKIQKNNAKLALFYNVMPIALDVLKKYENKPYGEKTKEKISNEVYDKTQGKARFYITNKYTSTSYSYCIHGIGEKDWNGYDVECGCKYENGEQKPLLIDNKIQIVNMEDLCVWYISDEYVEDIQERIAKLKELYTNAYAKQKELQDACDKFNKLAVGDIQHLYYQNTIYANNLH